MENYKKIAQFIAKHHVLTLATATQDGAPYCCNAFYAYDKADCAFIFTTDSTTRHGQMMLENNRVAASIVLETRIVGKIQGLQITGNIKPALEHDKATYLKRFPYAVVADLCLWRLEPDFMKLTDNTLGFGKKLIWQKEVL
ncbi:MAG: pyridoxamine 5'-phosphate oxidase family protein [Alistipes sp.]|nr:pyridoxamine 5'-phosphate oxidase family protein [Alistipes sp.]